METQLMWILFSTWFDEADSSAIISTALHLFRFDISVSLRAIICSARGMQYGQVLDYCVDIRVRPANRYLFDTVDPGG